MGTEQRFDVFGFKNGKGRIQQAHDLGSHDGNMAIADVAQVVAQVQTRAAHHRHRAKVFAGAIGADDFADAFVLKELRYLHVEIGEQLVERHVRPRALGRRGVGIAEHLAIGGFAFLQGIAQGRMAIETEQTHRAFAIGQAHSARAEQFLQFQNGAEHAALFHLEQVI